MPSTADRISDRGTLAELSDQRRWQHLLRAAGREAGARRESCVGCPADLHDLYADLCGARDTPLVLAHLGQSLDGHIALSCGASRWITGIDDRVHNQRLRALFDAVLVGAGTVIADDPRLTVREVAGPSPVRVVVEGRRPIPIDRRVFKDGQAPTVVVTGRPVSQAAADYPGAEVLQVAGDGDQARPQPHAVLDALFAAGLTRVFIEGGGAIISTFLAAGCLDRLQLTVAPVITGGGRPALCLPEAPSLDDALRPRTRIFQLGPDVLFDCELTRARP